MIEPERKLHHYFMLPFVGLAAITAILVFTWLIHAVIFQHYDSEQLVFDGACTVDSNDDSMPLTMSCGTSKVLFKEFSGEYYYELLTTGLEPVIMCTKTETRYYKVVQWLCNVNH